MGDLARVNTNVAALKAFLNLSDVNNRIVAQQEKISTGKIVNKASDSPANYFASRILTANINSLVRQQKNIERGINFLQTNDSKLAQVADILLQMSDLANQANSVAVSSAEKQAIQQDLTQLRMEVSNILQSGVSGKLFSNFTIGGLEDVKLTGSLPTISSLTIDGANISVTGTSTTTSIQNIDNALTAILEHEERLGSFIARLEFEMEDAAVEEVNTRASLSTLQDADLAAEQVELTKLQILQQAALAMLSQANMAPGSVMTLFSG